MMIRRFEKTIYTIRIVAVAFFVVLTIFLTIKGDAFVYDVEGPNHETLSGHDFSAQSEKDRDRHERPDCSSQERAEADRGFEKGNMCVNSR